MTSSFSWFWVCLRNNVATWNSLKIKYAKKAKYSKKCKECKVSWKWDTEWIFTRLKWIESPSGFVSFVSLKVKHDLKILKRTIGEVYVWWWKMCGGVSAVQCCTTLWRVTSTSAWTTFIKLLLTITCFLLHLTALMRNLLNAFNQKLLGFVHRTLQFPQVLGHCAVDC